MVKDTAIRSDPLRRRLRRLSPAQRREEARAFLRGCAAEHGLSDAEAAAREREALRDLSRHGFYRHSPDELAWGARVAWRNHARCIGRLHWKSLDVRDARAITEPDAIAAQCFAHLAEAQGNGHVRSIVTVFAPVEGSDLPVWIENPQIVSYAGHARPNAPTLGDPARVELTRIATSLGWRPPAAPTAFDQLPLILRDRGGERRVYALPEGLARECAISHPAHPGIDALGLRWYWVPVVSDMILSIGGIDYPCAPFNGHYMVTEIAARNLIDPFRYDRLEAVADAAGIDRTQSLWQDRALLVLHEAVLGSYQRDRVTIADHHQASAHYVDFVQREYASGRVPSAEWSWIVPPQAAAACPTFHLAMRDLHAVPAYYRDGATDGARLKVDRATEDWGVWRRRIDRALARYRRWIASKR